MAQTAGEKKPAPPKTVSVRITTRAPDPTKWNTAKSKDGARRIYVCKPLACSTPETVMFTFQKGSLKQPSPELLEKFATVELPKSIRAAAAAEAVMANHSEQVDTLFSKTATLKNYPSALNETKLTRGLTTFYVEIAIIFAGPVIVRVESKSESRDLAKNSLEGFIQELQIVEAEGPAPGAPSLPRPPKSENL